jgi:hypothetical protein
MLVHCRPVDARSRGGKNGRGACRYPGGLRRVSPREEKERIFEWGRGKHTAGIFPARVVLSITNLTIAETGDPGKGGASPD